MSSELKGQTVDRTNSFAATGVLQKIGQFEDNLKNGENIQTQKDLIVIIESRVLIRDCISRCIAQSIGWNNVCAFGDIDEWLAESPRYSKPTMILFCIGRRRKLDEDTLEKLASLDERDLLSRVVLLSDGEDADEILDALEQGVRGYIPTSVSLEVAIEAMHLVRAGGVYVPASSMIAARSAPSGGSGGRRSRLADVFTPRQAEVVEALRQGKANKVIAYDLNMQESTVKVHVRNIMKKLRARNRTEVAYLTRDLFESHDED